MTSLIIKKKECVSKDEIKATDCHPFKKDKDVSPTQTKTQLTPLTQGLSSRCRRRAAAAHGGGEGGRMVGKEGCGGKKEEKMGRKEGKKESGMEGE